MPTGYPNEQNDTSFSDRQYIRKNVAIEAHIRPLGGGKSLVKILDVSETGFRMNTPIIFDINKDIFLTMPGFQSLEANIVWHRQDLYGCTFLVPLHSAILEHISQMFAKQDRRVYNLRG